MDKVEEVYVAENKPEKVTEFLHTLQTFNQSTDKVEELYYVRKYFFREIFYPLLTFQKFYKASKNVWHC